MTIAIVCSACGHHIEVPESRAGSEIMCPACGRPVVVTPEPRAGDEWVRADGTLRRPGLVSAIAVFDLLVGALTLVGAVAWLLGAAAELRSEFGEPGFAFAMGSLLAVLAVLQIVAAIGLWRLRPAGRMLQISLAIVGLLVIPAGTLISAFILYYFYRPGLKVLFGGIPPADLTPAQRADLATMPGRRATAAAVIVVIVAFAFFCGLVSLVALPNFMYDVNLSRQKRTIADMRTLATTIEVYAVDHDLYPAGISSVADLEPLLVPTYLDALPLVDGWSEPFFVWTQGAGSAYSIVSFGSDHVRGPFRGGPVPDLADDIVLADGRFVQWPDALGELGDLGE